MNCKSCNKKISIKRLKAIPETEYCVECSEEQKMLGITVWDKTCPMVQIVKKSEADEFWRFEHGEGRFTRL